MSTAAIQFDEVFDDSEYSTLLCSDMRHLARLPRYAQAVYDVASRLSHKSGQFSVSIPELARYFGAHQRSIHSAIHALVDHGWLEVIKAERGKPVVYRVIKHDEWAKAHPDQCVEKWEAPWTDDVDRLAKDLFTMSAARIRFYPNMLRGLRNNGHSDEAIKAHFGKWWPSDTGGTRGAVRRFRSYLLAQPVI